MKETEILNQLKKRQLYYFEGNKLEKNGELENAISAYMNYSLVLAKEDQHIPHLWIADLYKMLKNENMSLIHLELYGNGCTDAKKAKIYKELGESYEDLGNFEKALDFFQRATSIDPEIGLKTKITNLQKQLL